MTVKRKDKSALSGVQNLGLVVLYAILALWFRELDISFLVRYAAVVMVVAAASAAILGGTIGISAAWGVEGEQSRGNLWILFFVAVGATGFLLGIVTSFSEYWHVAHRQPLDPHALTAALFGLWSDVFISSFGITLVALIAYQQFRRLWQRRAEDAPAREPWQ